MIPLFDSLAHPTLSGNWLHPKYEQKATFEQLAMAMTQAHYLKTCAIGMTGIEEYEHEPFIKKCQTYPNLVPIAGFDPTSFDTTTDLEANLSYLKQLGYVGIKIHPRFSNIRPVQDKEALINCLQLADKQELIVFYCTYQHCGLANYPTADPFYDLVAVLQKAQDTKVILVHGGDVNVLRYAELVRFNSNLLLDLSLTMMKYRDSSIDADIRFLFQQFDRRICIGTDFPEYTHEAVRRRFHSFAEGLPIAKQENVAFGNLMDFLDV